LIDQYGQENILCILSTTSCFAPREPDRVEAISKICKEKELFQVINNAYGVQCTKIANMINQAVKIGGVDFVVQSTDKNFMVPVGGSVVFARDKALLKELNSSYPGRASNSPIIDLFITLLEMGKTGWLNLLKERKATYAEFSQTLKEFAEKYGEEAIILKDNKISMALTIRGYLSDDANPAKATEGTIAENTEPSEFNPTADGYTKLGGILFKKRITGAKVVCENQKGKMVCGILMKNYGCCSDNYPHLPYITMAASIGGTKQELEDFLGKVKGYLKSAVPEEEPPKKDAKGGSKLYLF
jgi:O-phospho-L-seryl-tRNASec:L-selenocysteinyl-tRNA synthase